MRLEALVHGHYPGRALPGGALPGVKSVGFWDAVADQDWGLDWHQNEGIELTFLESGRLPFAVDEKRFELQPHDLTVTRPWQAHRVGDPHVTAGRLHWLILDVNVRRPHQPWRWPAWLVLTPADREELTRFLRQNEEPVSPRPGFGRGVTCALRVAFATFFIERIWKTPATASWYHGGKSTKGGFRNERRPRARK